MKSSFPVMNTCVSLCNVQYKLNIKGYIAKIIIFKAKEMIG